MIEWNGLKLHIDDDLLLVAACRALRRRNERMGIPLGWRRYNGVDAKTAAAESAIGALEEEEAIRVILATAVSLDDLLAKLEGTAIRNREALNRIADVPVFASEMPDWNYSSDERQECRSALSVDDIERDERIISFDSRRLLVMERSRPYLVRILG